METITGTVHKVLWFSPEKDNNYKVIVLKKNNNRYETVTGDFPDIVEGVSVEVHGDYKDHPKYGKGFKAKAHTFTYDKKSSISIALYLQSIAKFVGPVKSQDIANFFGEDLEDVIENHPERLCEVENIGEKIAQNIVKAWNDHREEKGVRIFLHSLGLSEALIRKIMMKFGLDAETKVRDNPFLLSFVGFGFSTCDFIAGKLGIEPNSPQRYIHFVLWCLKEAAGSGHLFLLDHQIVAAINAYNQNTSFKFKNTAITLKDLEAHLEYLVKEGYVINNENRYYELNLFFIENESARIISLIANSPDNIDIDHLDIESFIKNYEQSQQDPTKKYVFELSEDQRDAIRSFVKEKILVITGSPGTGKTTIVKSFVELMMANNIKFELLTPTGIASKKLGTTAGYEAYTIHRKLGYKGDTWDYGTTNKYDTDVIIVDETSMVDMEVFYRLISALHKHTKLVFVGDNDQLPSVGPGRVLNELIQSNVIKTIFLKSIFRQDEQSDIIKEAKRIKDGDTDLSLFKSDSKADIFFIRSSNVKEIEKLVMKFATQLKEKVKNSDVKKTFQIITPRNSGPLSVQTLNTVLQEGLNPKVEGEREITLNTCIIRKGDRVLIKKNNYDLGVFNGDVGKVKSILSSCIEVEIDDFDGNRDISVPIEIAEDHLKLAYSLTVHKCVVPSSKVATISGFIPIKDVSTKNRIKIYNVSSDIKWVGNTGKRKTIKITTKSGFELECGLEHKILIANNNGEKLIKACDIVVGQYACISSDVLVGKKIKLKYNSIECNNSRTPLMLPYYLNEDISWLLGAIIGDGTYRDKKDGIVEYSSPSDTELLFIFEKIVSSIGLKVCNHKKNEKLYSKYVSSKNFREWLFSIGFNYSLGPDKNIPEMIFSATFTNKKAFIAGLFDTDGCVDKKAQLRFTSSSIQLIKDLQILLLSIGIISFTSSQNPKHHKLLISGPDYTRFKNIIKLKNLKKRLRMQKYSSATSGKTNRYLIPYVKEIISWIRFEFNRKQGQGKKGEGLTGKNPKLQAALTRLKRSGKCIRQNIFNNIIEIAKESNIDIPEKYLKIYENKTYYDPIKNLVYSCEEKETCDIEVDRTDHLLSIGGFICHNSQGMEYDLIILPIVKMHGKRILQRNLLYTALTRAKKKVLVIGQGSAIVDAIENDKIQERNTLLAERIRLWKKGEGISLQQLYSNPSNYQNVQTLRLLLSSEESTSADTAPIRQSEPDSTEHPLKPSQFSRQSRPESLEDILRELDSKIDSIFPEPSMKKPYF